MKNNSNSTISTPMGEGIMHGNVCVVTQTGNENWSLDLWHEALDGCSREFISQNIMVEFLGYHIDCDTGEEEKLAPVYFALILSNGLSYFEVSELVKKRVSQRPAGTACFVRWMDQQQRDSKFIVNHFYIYDDMTRWFDKRTGKPLNYIEVDHLIDSDLEDVLHGIDQSSVVDWGQELLDDVYYDEIYRTMEMYFPLLERREEHHYCHPRNLFTTGFISTGVERGPMSCDGLWIDGKYYEDVFCNNLSVWGIPNEVLGFDDMSHFDLEYDEIKRIFDDQGRLAKYLPK